MQFDIDQTLPIPARCDACRFPRVQLTTNERAFGNKSLHPLLRIWFCPHCKASVGVHPDTDLPTGYMAGPRIRALRARAHSLLDPMWRYGQLSRKQCYGLLSRELQIPGEQCHIGMFNEDELRKAIAFLEHYQSDVAAVERRRKEKKVKRDAKRAERQSVRTRLGREEDYRELRIRKRR